MTDKIYMHVVDGSDALISFINEQLNENEFLIKELSDFDPDDSSFIPQFIPGDIVTRKLEKKENRQYWKADKLLKPSDHPDKMYFEFLYRIVTADKPKDEKERLKYADAIRRTRQEVSDGKFHYPAIINYIKGIEDR